MHNHTKRGKTKCTIQRNWQHMVHKRKNNTNTYVLDTTICTQTQIPQISHVTNNWRKRRTEHHFYAEIVTDITTRNTEYINKVTQITPSEMFGSL